MGYDVLELRELEYERYARHPVVLEYKWDVREMRRVPDSRYFYACEIYINGIRLQELLPLSVDEGEETLYEIGWLGGFIDMLERLQRRNWLGRFIDILKLERRNEGYFPILWDGLHDPEDEGDITVHIRIEDGDVVWDGFFQGYSHCGTRCPLPSPIFRFKQERYEAAIRSICHQYGVSCP